MLQHAHVAVFITLTETENWGKLVISKLFLTNVLFDTKNYEKINELRLYSEPLKYL